MKVLKKTKKQNTLNNIEDLGWKQSKPQIFNELTVIIKLEEKQYHPSCHLTANLNLISG